VTLLHPAQGERLDTAWNEIAVLPSRGRFRVAALDVIAGSGAQTRVLESFTLRG
jgi:hypothetical protein